MKKKARPIISYAALALGIVIASLSYDLFFMPNDIAPGGFSGLAMVINTLTGAPVGITMIILNLPLFVLTFIKLGRTFVMKSFAAMMCLSLLIDLIPEYPLTRDPLLASVYGGFLLGAGLGLILRNGATTGGTDMLATLVHHTFKINIPMAWVLFGVDIVVVTLAGVVFSPQAALYAIVSLFIISRIIDMIQEGVNSAKAFFIITNAPEAIADRVMREMDRGATTLHGRGMYTGEGRDILFCVVQRDEVSHLKGIVAGEDPKAFLVVTDVREAMGEGFLAHKK